MGLLSVPDDFPNRLMEPQSQALRPAPWLLLFLVALCAAPRALMAWRLPSVCPDGVLYIHLAQAIEAGNWRAALEGMNLNLYPFLLAELHGFGLGWETAAGLWGVMISSLVVLPLWGWVRRQFDDRVALISCLLYAVNPKLIEWSPEVMRDPTFWFLFVLAIYWLWRAVSEVHLGYFVAAGGAIVLASLTRIEGLFLLIPMTFWMFWQFKANPTKRRRLLLGVILCLAAFPSLFLLVNATWLYGQFDWTLLRLDPLARVEPWLHSILGWTAADSFGDVNAKPLGAGRMIWIFIPTMTRGLSPVFALLMFGGIWGWRRTWFRRDHQALFYTAIVIMCGIWIQLWYDKTICPRYALPIVLMALPWASLGAIALTARLLRAAAWFQRDGAGWQRAIVAGVGIAVLGLSLGDALTSNRKYFQTRRTAANLGEWVRTTFRTPPTLVGPVGITPIVSFYGNDCPFQTFRWEDGDELILTLAREPGADIVLLQPAKELTVERCERLMDRLGELGLRLLRREELPETYDAIYVLRRRADEPTAAQRR